MARGTVMARRGLHLIPMARTRRHQVEWSGRDPSQGEDPIYVM
ncbi:hypothetical protein SOVF_109810 [Spinacia oleracea]|nr:hypothetical protein SOVF_109810 [Spinacia oleracea]